MKKLIPFLLIILFSYSPYILSKQIHAYGESHALRFFANEKLSGSYVYNYSDQLSIPIEIHWLGPKTMHSFGRDGLKALDITQPRQLDLIKGSLITITGKAAQEDDIIVFTLGEIDVRNHIGKQRDAKKRSLEEILDILVENYFNTINLNRAHYNHLNCVVVEIIPPIKSGKQKDNLPFYGTLEDRVNITRILNKKLKKACAEHSCIYLPIHDLYALPNGSLNPAFGDGSVHITFKSNYLIRERLIKTLIEYGVLP